MGLLKCWFKTSERPKKVHSKWNSTLNRDLNVESVTMAGSNQWEAKKSPVHSKWNSTLNRDLNVESVTRAGSKPVRGQKKSIQNGILYWTAISMWNLWLRLVQNQWEAEKNPFKMEFYTEPRSQCGTKFPWLRRFKTSDRPKNVHSKWNWTVISMWN